MREAGDERSEVKGQARLSDCGFEDGGGGVRLASGRWKGRALSPPGGELFGPFEVSS